MSQQTVSKQSSGNGMEVQGITKIFKGRRGKTFSALVDVNMTVAPREFVCLLGPSGCGKSTLLHILAGLTKASEGTIRVGDSLVKGPGPDRGILFQQATLFPWLTVRQNVLFGPCAQKVKGPATEERAMALIDRVGLSSSANKYPHELSGGMQHRAAFARALINEPAVLLLDEPFAALDAITRAGMQDFLVELWQQSNTSIVFVTHDIAEAALLGDRVCVMSTNPGRIDQIVDIDLPRPRLNEMTETRDFVEVRNKLRHCVAKVLKP